MTLPNHCQLRGEPKFQIFVFIFVFCLFVLSLADFRLSVILMLVCLFQFYLQLEESLAILMDPIFPDEQMEPAVKPALMSSTLAA
jgi:hypothetical protein